MIVTFHSKPGLILSSSLQQHANYLNSEVYSKPYPNGQPRKHHGFSHVMRAMMFGTMLVNVLKALGHPYSHYFASADFVKKIQLALLLHDSGREGDGTDTWDLESATNIYNYFTKILGCSHEEALEIAEAMANKDCFTKANNGKKYYCLKVEKTAVGQNIVWDEIPLAAVVIPERIKAMIMAIQFGDGVDILRARRAFDPSYSQYYQDCAKQDDFQCNIFCKILNEARSCIERHGETFGQLNPKKQQMMNSSDGFKNILQDLHDHAPFSAYLFNNGELHPTINRDTLQKFFAETPIVESTPTKYLSNAELQQLMDDGCLVLRAEASPTAKYGEETFGELSFRKAHRNNGLKKGSPYRSAHLAGPGINSFYAAVGTFNILRGNTSRNLTLRAAHTHDVWSGRGKKKPFFKRHHKSEEQITDALNKLRESNRFGGDSNHNEIIADLKGEEGLWFTRDPSAYHAKLGADIEKDSNGKPLLFYSRPHHDNITILEMVYLKYLYASKTKKELPIIEVSAIHNKVSRFSITEDQVIALWIGLLEIYLNKLSLYNIENITAENLKINLMYDDTKSYLYRYDLTAADASYPPGLKSKLDDALQQRKITKLHEMLDKHIHEISQKEWLSEYDLQLILRAYKTNLVQSIMKERVKKIISEKISQCLKDESPSNFYYKNINLIQQLGIEIPIEVSFQQTLELLSKKDGFYYFLQNSKEHLKTLLEFDREQGNVLSRAIGHAFYKWPLVKYPNYKLLHCSQYYNNKQGNFELARDCTLLESDNFLTDTEIPVTELNQYFITQIVTQGSFSFGMEDIEDDNMEGSAYKHVNDLTQIAEKLETLLTMLEGADADVIRAQLIKQAHTIFSYYFTHCRGYTPDKNKFYALIIKYLDFANKFNCRDATLDEAVSKSFLKYFRVQETYGIANLAIVLRIRQELIPDFPFNKHVALYLSSRHDGEFLPTVKSVFNFLKLNGLHKDKLLCETLIAKVIYKFNCELLLRETMEDKFKCTIGVFKEIASTLEFDLSSVPTVKKSLEEMNQKYWTAQLSSSSTLDMHKKLQVLHAGLKHNLMLKENNIFHFTPPLKLVLAYFKEILSKKTEIHRDYLLKFKKCCETIIQRLPQGQEPTLLAEFNKKLIELNDVIVVNQIQMRYLDKPTETLKSLLKNQLHNKPYSGFFAWFKAVPRDRSINILAIANELRERGYADWVEQNFRQTEPSLERDYYRNARASDRTVQVPVIS